MIINMKRARDKIHLLRRVQRQFSRKVRVRDKFLRPLMRVAGIDLAFTNNVSITACVITRLPDLTIISKKILIRKLMFPYIPSLLCFREGPPIIALINSLRKKLGVILINAHGIAHPLYCGCASYVGVVTKAPTIGVAANNLCSEYKCDPQEVGDSVAMYFQGRQVGWVLKSKQECKPLYVSPGHNIGFNSCLEVVKKTIRNHKFPEPLWFAHQLANEEKRKLTSVDS